MIRHNIGTILRDAALLAIAIVILLWLQSADYLARVDLYTIEEFTWHNSSKASFPPTFGARWDGANVYMPWIARNIDRSVRYEGSNLSLYYAGDNSEGTDNDQIGLARGPSIDEFLQVGTNPVIALDTPTGGDAGDAQAPNVWWDGSQYIMYYQGNETPPEPPGTALLSVRFATSPDGIAWTKQANPLAKAAAPGQDSRHQFVPKLVPNAPGGARLYYTGQNQTDLLFGIMGAVSSGDLSGPWTRLSDDTLYGPDGLTMLGDAWYDEVAEIYHAFYFGVAGGVQHIVSTDGLAWTFRQEIFSRHHQHWDTAPAHCSWVQIGNRNYLLFSSSTGLGIGYAYN